jgi:hypothetical protein
LSVLQVIFGKSGKIFFGETYEISTFIAYALSLHVFAGYSKQRISAAIIGRGGSGMH